MILLLDMRSIAIEEKHITLAPTKAENAQTAISHSKKFRKHLRVPSEVIIPLYPEATELLPNHTWNIPNRIHCHQYMFRWNFHLDKQTAQ